MNKTKIEWTDYTVNPIKSLCKHACSYCYARRMYERFKWDETVRLDLSAFQKLEKIKQPSKIFICSTHDLFGSWIPDKWITKILSILQQYPQHTFQLLTKSPQRVYLMNLRLPDNCWFGTTVTHNNDINWRRMFHLIHEDKGKHIQSEIKFISFEPLIEELDLKSFYYFGDIDWVIIGAMTGRHSGVCQPTPEAIGIILRACDKHNIPVFMKDNIRKVWKGELRQEFPGKELE